jgi:hypothetical protein
MSEFDEFPMPGDGDVPLTSRDLPPPEDLAIGNEGDPESAPNTATNPLDDIDTGQIGAEDTVDYAVAPPADETGVDLFGAPDDSRVREYLKEILAEGPPQPEARETPDDGERPPFTVVYIPIVVSSALEPRDLAGTRAASPERGETPPDFETPEKPDPSDSPLEPVPPLEELLPFAVPHDGTQPEVPPAEREVVAQKFDALVDDIHLNAADRVEHSSIVVPEDRLLVRIPAEEGHWRGAVTAKTDVLTHDTPFPPSAVVVKSINLSYYANGSGPQRQFVSYRLCGDGIVRRFNGGDRAMAHQNSKALDKTAGVPKPTSVGQEMDRLLFDSIDRARSRHVEEKLGYQNQPVGITEIDGLIDFITKPDVVVDDEYRRR